MREIIFRGKRIDNGEWIYGDLLHVPKKEYASIFGQEPCDSNIPVIYSTVGQFVGIKDRNGVEIYEGDIVKNDFYRKSGEVKFGKYMHSKCDEYDCEHYSFYIDCIFSDYCENTGISIDLEGVKYLEIIGNIYDIKIKKPKLNSITVPKLDFGGRIKENQWQTIH